MSTPTTKDLILGREPAFWTSFVMAVVAAVVAFGTPIGTETQGYIQAFVNAVLAAVLAVKVRPIAVPIFVGVVQTALPLLVAVGLDLTTDQQGVLLTLAPIVLNLLLVRPQVTPAAPLAYSRAVVAKGYTPSRPPGIDFLGADGSRRTITGE